MKSKHILCLLGSIVIGANSFGQEQKANTWFGYAPYGKSLYADVHPNTFRFDIAGFSNRPEVSLFSSTQKYRASSYGVFGAELPIWNGNFSNNKYGVSLTLALSANLWLDLFEPVTAPVVNTDYRIGIPSITFIHRTDLWFLKNYSLQYSPFKHESTHMGDELQIHRVEEQYAIRRVNVSYNYQELLFTINEPENRMAECHTLRLGIMLLWNWRKGWYSVMPEASDVQPDIPSDQYVHPKCSPWELWLQYQYQSKASKHGFQAIVSAEIRNRVQYGYDLQFKEGETDPAPYDKRQFTYNAFVGCRYNIPHYDGYLSRFALGFRAYYGICPYGMFRNINNYTQFGLSLIWQ